MISIPKTVKFPLYKIDNKPLSIFNHSIKKGIENLTHKIEKSKWKDPTYYAKLLLKFTDALRMRFLFGIFIKQSKSWTS